MNLALRLPRRAAAILLSLCGVALAQPVAVSWVAQPLPPLSVARAGHQALRLADGALWVVGGCSGPSCTPLQASGEALAAGATAFRPAGALATARVSHRAVALPDGRVLVLGGWDGQRDSDRAELWDPRTQRTTAAPNMQAGRQSAVAVALADGRVLVAGGGAQRRGALDLAEAYEPARNRFTPLPAMHAARTHHTGVPLADGRVLIAGGLDAQGHPLASAELFDPARNRFTPTGPMASPRYKHAAVALPDGRVLVLGGSHGRDDQGLLASTELWDPATGRFSPGPQLVQPRYKFADAVLAVAGGVLVGGGARRPEWWDGQGAAFVALPIDLGATWEFATLTPGATPDEALLLGGYDHAIVPTARGWRLRLVRTAGP